MRVVFLLLLLLLPVPLSVQAEDLRSHKTPPDKLLQPMNVPMDELGVTGHDTTLCSDRWYTCSSYDRQQFDQKYIGVPLNEFSGTGSPIGPPVSARGGVATAPATLPTSTTPSTRTESPFAYRLVLFCARVSHFLALISTEITGPFFVSINSDAWPLCCLNHR